MRLSRRVHGRSQIPEVSSVVDSGPLRCPLAALALAVVLVLSVLIAVGM